MTDFFYQLVLFLAGAVIGIVVPRLQHRRQKLIAGLLSIALIGVSVIWAGYELRASAFLAPTPTPLNDSPKAIIDWYLSSGTQVQAEELAKKRYYGKVVQWGGTIRDVVPVIDSATIYLDVDGQSVYARFKDKSSVAALIKGEYAVVFCKIAEINSYTR